MIEYSEQKFKDYFEGLDYTVSWDFKKATGEVWWEILKDGELVCQVDKGCPIEYLIEDFLCWERGEKGTSPVDFQVNTNGPDDEKFNKLLQKVKAAPLK